MHGPLGAREKSWTYDGTVWLKDILPGDMPKANIYTYGYRSESPLDIIAQNFIKALDNVRGNRSLYDTPIAFVTHAKGGLIVKQVSQLAHLILHPVLISGSHYVEHGRRKV